MKPRPIFLRLTPSGRLADFGGFAVAHRTLDDAVRFSRAVSTSFHEPECVVGSVMLDDLAAGLAEAECCTIAEAKQMIIVEPDARRLSNLYDVELVLRGEHRGDLDEVAAAVHGELDLPAVAERHAVRLLRLAELHPEFARHQLVRLERLSALADRLDDKDAETTIEG